MTNGLIDTGAQATPSADGRVYGVTVAQVISNLDLTGQGRVIGLMFPMAWFQPISVGTFTKGLSYSDLWSNASVLAFFAVAYFVAALVFLRKQET